MFSRYFSNRVAIFIIVKHIVFDFTDYAFHSASTFIFT
jgi:hypothetical protein